ncbi:M67 family metallopeptidase [Paenibacillus naphthalenovorans]|uniref:Prokaryotic JAB domain-containing protein n=1 Tax=Paenibacillus naphthalenovorans TaxID=162209 RepID=A0A0U2W3C7_9BACL|nr:M67 family metallopeptidase [Paenibacillus naphthalenovorans]ALS21022.1 prokaryotic JAB domain-containing protein [Paenibacillus naphthalenovorans]GCL71057.1 hypothetical protein PN4B1_09610 [Paenibacillus naphthalenovorans]SDI61796.1 Proteasome lid subunit RPN8/RPN11, contains Jab1/MPN metalloenzyme (JAMM) motif [Paenibacillus naphthalenovorans]
MSILKSLCIRREAWTAMLRHCIEQKPQEACGFLFGSNEREMDYFVPVANVHNEPERHFLMDPEEMIRALFAGRHGNQKPAGIVHSHPRTPPVPSAEDIRSSWRGAAWHWIVSLEDPQIPLVKAYQYVQQGDGTWHYTSYPFEILESDCK